MLNLLRRKIPFIDKHSRTSSAVLIEALREKMETVTMMTTRLSDAAQFAADRATDAQLARDDLFVQSGPIPELRVLPDGKQEAWFDTDAQLSQKLRGIGSATGGSLAPRFGVDVLLDAVMTELEQGFSIEPQLVAISGILKAYFTPSAHMRVVFARMDEQSKIRPTKILGSLTGGLSGAKGYLARHIASRSMVAGPLFIKLLQNVVENLEGDLASMQDLIDNTPFVSDEEADIVYTRMLQEDPSLAPVVEQMRSDPETKLAAASLSQVHRVTVDSRAAVVKFLRPTSIFNYACETAHMLGVGWVGVRAAAKAAVERKMAPGVSVPAEAVEALTVAGRKLLLFLLKAVKSEFDLYTEALCTSYAHVLLRNDGLAVPRMMRRPARMQVVPFMVQEFATVQPGRGGKLVSLKKAVELVGAENDPKRKLVMAEGYYRAMLSVLECLVGYALLSVDSLFHGDLHGGNVMVRLPPADAQLDVDGREWARGKQPPRGTPKKGHAWWGPVTLIDWGNNGSVKTRLRCGLVQSILELSPLNHTASEVNALFALADRVAAVWPDDRTINQSTLDSLRQPSNIMHMFDLGPEDSAAVVLAIFIIVTEKPANRAARLREFGYDLNRDVTLAHALAQVPDFSARMKQADVHVENSLRILAKMCNVQPDLSLVRDIRPQKMYSRGNDLSPFVAIISHFFVLNQGGANCFMNSAIFFGRSLQLLLTTEAKLRRVLGREHTKKVLENRAPIEYAIKRHILNHPGSIPPMAFKCAKQILFE